MGSEMSTEEIVKTVAGTIVLSSVAFSFALIRKWVEFSDLLASLFFLLSLTLILMMYFKIKSLSILGLSMGNTIERAEFILKVVSTDKISWLLTEDQLIALEKGKRRCRTIWVVCRDPTEDTGDTAWAQVLKDNINDGIQYVYVAPKSKALNGAITGLKSVFRGNLELCKIVELEVEEYERLPYEHFVLYDPHNLYDEFDSLAEIDVEEKGWWMRVSRNKRNMMIGRLAPYIRAATPLSQI